MWYGCCGLGMKGRKKQVAWDFMRISTMNLLVQWCPAAAALMSGSCGVYAASSDASCIAAKCQLLLTHWLENIAIRLFF